MLSRLYEQRQPVALVSLTTDMGALHTMSECIGVLSTLKKATVEHSAEKKKTVSDFKVIPLIHMLRRAIKQQGVTDQKATKFLQRALQQPLQIYV